LSVSVLADPALFRVGAFELRWSGVLLALGLALGYLAVRAAATRAGLGARTLHDAALWSLPEALLAARVAYVLVHPEIYLTAPSRVLHLWDGGFSFGAGLLVGLWAVQRHAQRHELPCGRLLDAAVPGLLIAQGLAALGRCLDIVMEPGAPLPPWSAPLTADAAVAASPILLTDSLLLAPLATALWAFALLLAYALLARRSRVPGLFFRAYLLFQALGQVAIRVMSGGAAPDPVGIVAWAAVAVAAALSALYHLRSADYGVTRG
jgi:phosphatidylglycerol:prolipoprotein diacylglycerol transferase